MTDRETVHKAILELDASDELKEVLRMLISFADEEDERTYFKLKNEYIAELRDRIGHLEEEAGVL